MTKVQKEVNKMSLPIAIKRLDELTNLIAQSTSNILNVSMKLACISFKGECICDSLDELVQLNMIQDNLTSEATQIKLKFKDAVPNSAKFTMEIDY